jgi:PD-(D/E)XK nuclease superfamily
MEGAVLTPTQERVLTEVMGSGAVRPTFGADLACRLRADLEERLSPVADQLQDGHLVVHKSALARVHTCEGHHLAEAEAGFSWSPAAAVGVVAHKAIELSVSLARPDGLAELVDLAMERLAADPDRGPGAWLAGASELDRAEVRGGAIDRALKFEDEFPPVKRSWRPRLESTLLTSLCEGRIVVRGKVDLALGQARGTRAGVLIVDFKTGRPRRDHTDDLRFYALLETLRAGVPPFRVASWYLDSGQCHHEDVDEELLGAAARRLVDGARKLYELDVARRPPTLTPGPVCHYCSARETCPQAPDRTS